MSDMGWSIYVRDQERAAEQEREAKDKDMLPHMRRHLPYTGPHDMYSTFYRYTDCGPWVSMRVNGAWVHCQDLHKLGTWDDMRKRCDIVDEVMIGSIVEGVDEEAGPVLLTFDDLRSKRSKTGNITMRSVRLAFDRAVTDVDADATRIWNATHGCERCIIHWNELGVCDESGQECEAVWTECPICGGAGQII